LSALGFVLLLALGAPSFAAADKWIVTGSPNTVDGVSTTILLHDDTVLALSGTPAVDDSELYDPATGTWRDLGPVGPGPRGRVAHAAVLLRSGQVLVTGGDIDGTGPSKSCRLYDPTSGTWSDAGSLNVPRLGHTATLLADGRVLVVGGRDATSAPTVSAELYDPGSDTWTLTDSLADPREKHTATYLPGDRTVLVAGGRTTGGVRLNRSEVYDVGSETWVTVSVMTIARSDHSATLLPNGLVLVAGGDNTEGAELYDPGGASWSPTGSLPEARWMHSATLLPSGLVLVAGGHNAATLKTAYVYDFNLGQFTRVADLTVGRFGHAATMLPDGRVLVVGGRDATPLKDAELYDQDAPTWTLDLDMQEARVEHLTVLLKDGRVLAVGGVGSKTAETFDPSTAGPWKLTGDMSAIRYRGTATLLNDGRVLAAGTIASGGVGQTADIFEPGPDIWTSAASMAGNRYEHSASLLACGEVLVAGGESSSGVVLDTAERYNPQSDTWRSTGKMNQGRWAHTATTLLDGRILVTGGWNGGTLATAEIYDPDTEIWAFTAGNMSTGRYHHRAVLLPSGKVLILAGSFSNNTGEIFDPATGLFTPLTRNLITGRSNGFTATLLLNGRVLIVGGSPTGGTSEAYDPAAVNNADKLVAYPNLNASRNNHSAVLLEDGRVLVTGGGDIKTEVFDIGRGGSIGWAPLITDVTNPLVEGSVLTAAGVRFEGLGEASSGLGSQHSATNYPLVQLRHLDSDRVRWLHVGPGAKWTDTSFDSAPVTGCIPGPTRATVFTNGIPSVSHIIMLECLPPTVTTSPVNAEACVGGSASFTVAATGKCPAYRWRKNTSPLLDGGVFSGTATPTLNITGATLVEAGTYDAVASLSCSSTAALSGSASLTVHSPLSGVSANLVSGTDTVCPSCLGGTFAEGHGGGGPVTYKWGYRLTSGGTVFDIPGQTGSTYVLNGADLPGPGSYFIVVTTTPLCGSVLVSNEVPATVTATTGSGDVPFFTVTSRDQENVLEWVYPGGTLDVRIRYTSGPTCTPPTDPVTSGTFLVDQTGITPGQKDRYVHSPLTNDTTYCYTIFAGTGPWSPGRSNSGRPMDTTGPVKWAFSTGVFSITAPTVGGSAILATSNEPVIHAMQRGVGPTSGEWPLSWKPLPVDGAVQSRLPVVPVTVGGVNPVGYLGTQMGSVFVIDAVQGGAAVSPYPWAPVTPTPVIQAAPAGMFTAFGGSYDYLVVGSRVGGADNEVYVVDALAGGVLDTFNNGGGAGAIGVINGMGSLAYGVDRFYFASHDRGGGSLWCLDLSGPPLPLMVKRWSRALGDIDSSPVLSGGAVYVGSTIGGGTLYAVEAVDGLAVNDRTFLHNDGQVKGFVFPDRPSGDLYFATDNYVWALNDNGSTIGNKFAGPIVLPAGAKPTSAVLFVPGDHYVYVGADDGKLYEIDVSGAAPVIKGQALGDGLATVGSPSLDWPNALIHVGTEAGIFYAIAYPFP